MRRILPVILALLLIVSAPLRAVQADVTPPAATAELIRTTLVHAQLVLGADAASAAQDLQTVNAAYSDEFALTLAQAAPEADAYIQAGLEDLLTAQKNADARLWASARAQVWTGILAGSYAVVEQALQRNDIATAREWLTVREFRQATRFSRPDADATLAVEKLAAGEISAEEAVLTLHADWLDTYQARLTEALDDLAGAQANNFSVRMAEHAALARGYFALLATAYAEQRGPAALAALQMQFTQLQAAALTEADLTPILTTIKNELQNFRAAPLSPEEQSRRAGQLLRYLSLVPIEYGRGVINGVVTKDIEIQEAATFYNGAKASFNDLRSLLNERDFARTQRAADLLQAVGLKVNQAATQPENAPAPDAVRGEVEALTALLTDLMPAEWQKQSAAGDFDVIETLLDQMENAVRAGDYALAESARLEAYAIMEVGPEAKLMAFAPQMKLTLEALFWNGQDAHKGLAYLLKTGAPLSEIKASRAELNKHLGEAQTMLAQQSAPIAVATNAGLIVFREGLEAVVILASLMSSLKGANARLRRPLWVGTLAAILGTAATWLLARGVLQAFARYGETLEAVVSLIAIGILLLITNWFFHKMYWTDWIANFHQQKKRLISGAAGLWLGLMTLGFTSVYREGFETVLFLQALVLEAGNAVTLSGVAVGFALVILIGIAIFKFQVNLPQKKILIVTGVLIGGVLLTMVGHTAHILQVIGWLPLHPIAELPLPYWMGIWFGLYPTWEGLLLQAASTIFVIGSYYLAENMKDGKRQTAPPKQPKRKNNQSAYLSSKHRYPEISTKVNPSQNRAGRR